MYVCIHMDVVCMYVCMYVRTYVCMYVCMYVCTYDVQCYVTNLYCNFVLHNIIRIYVSEILMRVVG